MLGALLALTVAVVTAAAAAAAAARMSLPTALQNMAIMTTTLMMMAPSRSTVPEKYHRNFGQIHQTKLDHSG